MSMDTLTHEAAPLAAPADSADDRAPACRLCGSGAPALVYRGPIRSGAFGQWTRSQHAVLQCEGCGCAYLDPFPEVDYSDSRYREAYDGSADPHEFLRRHDAEQLGYLSLLRGRSLRDKVIVDIGAGGGSFLDCVAGQARRTIAVEPYVGYHASLRARRHTVFPDLAAMLEAPDLPRVDLAVCFHVLEHVPDPVRFLQQVRGALHLDGVLYLVTPNRSDLLLRLGFPSYQRFFYRLVHLWYFSESSLRWLAREAGYAVERIFFLHSYDLSNAFCWAHEGVPTGRERLRGFDERINGAWKDFLEQTGQADAVGAVLIPQGKASL